MHSTYKRTSHQVIAKKRFIQLAEIEYASASGTTAQWEVVQRTTRPPIEYGSSPVSIPLDAVEICAIVRCSPSEQGRLVVVAQYRPPVDAVVLEFPAGLVDLGENPSTAALRELKEETGFVAKPEDVRISKLLCSDPGITDSCFVLATVQVDGSIPENINPKQRLDTWEDIAVLLVPVGPNLSEVLQRHAASFGPRSLIDGKLFTFAMGLSLSSHC